jgi:galactose mutarotase-like enzyme
MSVGLAGMLSPDAIGNPDQLASAVESVVADGPAAGCRAIDLRVWDGIDLRLLPDHALDAGAAWYRGVPLAWISPTGETGRIPNPRDQDWGRTFNGGLMTTCGLRNVGVPSDGHGQHGEIHEQPAAIEAIERTDGGVLTVRGRVAEVDALRFNLQVQRSWRTRVGEGRVELVDVVRNRGREPEPLAMLYHVNFGAPLWDEGAELVLDARATHPRDEDAAPFADSWMRGPGVVPGARERVFEHEVTPGDDGWAEARVRNERLGLEVAVRWDTTTMPRLWQWVHPAPGLGVLGLEPANCSVLGRAHDLAEGRLPVLAPGEERISRLEIRARGL